jgi:hypothetical protein
MSLMNNHTGLASQGFKKNGNRTKVHSNVLLIAWYLFYNYQEKTGGKIMISSTNGSIFILILFI